MPTDYSPTQAFAVKREIHGALFALDELSGVQVCYNDPIGELEREAVYLGAVKWESEEATTNRGRKEVYTIDLFINVQMRGSDPIDLDRRVEELFALVENYLRAHPVVANGKSTNMEMRPVRAIGAPNPDGYEAEIKAEILCTTNK